MMEYLPDISPVAFAILLLCSLLGSLLSASAGIGGGSFLIAVMASLVPPAALIPLHGLVQLGSNASRAYLTREHTQWRKIAFFALGALLAATLAGLLLGMLDPHYIPPLVGVFILWLSWGKMPDIGLGSHPVGLFFGGLLTTLGTMLVGATGPLVAAWLGRSGIGRWQYTANFSASMTIQHTVKVLAFETETGHEYWLGFDNFYSITRYNHSPLYAMVAYQLSEQIASAYEHQNDS